MVNRNVSKWNVKKEIVDIPLANISVDHSTQIRVGNKLDAVADYAVAMAAGDEFPPIIVFCDAAESKPFDPLTGIFWIGDGFTRIAAATVNQAATIKAEIRRGTRSDAIRLACAANSKHGQRLSVADKQKAVKMYHAEFPGEPVNAIAKACCVSWTFADKIINPGQYLPDGRTKQHANRDSSKNRTQESQAREREPGDDDPDFSEPETKTPSRAGADKPAEKEPATSEPPVRDRHWKEVPAHLRDVFGDRWHTDTVSTLEKLKTQARSIMNWSVWLEPEVLDELERLTDRIKRAIPFAICPSCKAASPDGCADCKTGGYVPEHIESILK